MSDPLTQTERGVEIAVWVVPGSSRSAIDGRHGNHIKIRVTAPPEGGKANEEASRLLTRHLGAEASLKSGMRSRSKVFVVSRINYDAVRKKLRI